MTAHGKTKDYLHRFKIIDSSECTCGAGNQTVDHLIDIRVSKDTEGERSPSKKHSKTRNLAEGEKWTSE